MSGIRRLGDGYEPHVDEVANTLTYSLPVDSSIVSVNFSFEISEDDLSVLHSDTYRRAALEVIAHTILQRSLGQSSTRITQPAFDALVSLVLHAASAELEDYIARISRDHNMAVSVFIDEAMARRGVGKTH